MNLKYFAHSTDLKELNHIEWFVLHANEYSFQGEKSLNLFLTLKDKISKKNIYYSDIVKDYESLVAEFNNDPYEYAFDYSGANSLKEISTERINNYFVEVKDHEGTACMAPYGYVVEKGMERYPGASKLFGENVRKSQQKAQFIFRSIEDHYLQYWKNGGVKDAISQFKGIHDGKDYHLIKTSIYYVFYNILLLILLRESCYFPYFANKIFPGSTSTQFTVEQLFTGHKLLGLFVLVGITYLLYYDFLYTYGLYRLIFIYCKYNGIKNYHNEVIQLYAIFAADYGRCLNGIPSGIIQKTRNRDSVYIPLILKTSVKFSSLTDPRPSKMTEYPMNKFFKKPIGKKIKWMLLLWVIVRAFCNRYYMLDC